MRRRARTNDATQSGRNPTRRWPRSASQSAIGLCDETCHPRAQQARGVANELPVRQGRQICVGRHDPARAWLLDAYCDHGAPVAGSLQVRKRRHVRRESRLLAARTKLANTKERRRGPAATEVHAPLAATCALLGEEKDTRRPGRWTTVAMRLMPTFEGASGYERAEYHQTVLNCDGIPHRFVQELPGGGHPLRTSARTRRGGRARSIRLLIARRKRDALRHAQLDVCRTCTSR